MVNITINKYPIPIIWLDTSALINITRGRLNASEEDKRYRSLADTIYRAVWNSKLICPQVDQMEEITRSFSEVQKTISLLSRGIHFRHGSDIKEIQMQNAMLAYINKTNVIEINYQDAFEKDPSTDQSKNNGMIIDIYGIKSKRLLQKERDKKSNYLAQLNELRRMQREKRISFSEQVKEELTGEYQAALEVQKIWSRVCSGLHYPSEEELSQISVLKSMVHFWNLLGGNPPDLEGFLEFLHSPDWKATPCNDIPANLFAKLITNSGPIEDGDPKDVNHLTVALPYCHYIVCDKKMRNLVKELELNSKYNAQVFSIADVDEIIHAISE